MKHIDFNPDKSLNRNLDGYRPDFKPFFEQRLMAKIRNINANQFSKRFDKIFSQVLVSGVAAVALLLITIYISNGMISSDALIGINDLSLENSFAILLNSY